jgi:PAS domain S-box-containing protein
MQEKDKSLPILIIAEIVFIAVLVTSTIYVLTLQNQAHKQLDKAIQLRHTSFSLADQLRQSSDDLTRMVRTYAATGESRFEDYFHAILDIRAGKAPRPENYDRIFWDFKIVEKTDVAPSDGEMISLKELMAQAGITDSELQLLSEAERRSNELVKLENEAMFAMKGILKDTQGNYTLRGDQDQRLATDILFSKEYHLAKKNIMTPINDFLAAVETRTQKTLTKAQNKIQHLSTRSTYLYFLLVGIVPILVYTIRKQQKIAASGLRESEEKFRLLLNSTAEAIYGLDIKGNCTFCNPACVGILGYERENDLLGKNMYELIHHYRPEGTEYPEKEGKAYLPFLKGEGVHVDGEVFWRADGSQFDAEYCSYPIFKGEDVIGSVVTFHDISERKKVRADLVEAKKIAEKANAAKSDFLANISHEIRTPITVFIGAIEYLREINKDPKCREVLDLASISSNRLFVLLNDVLDHSKIEAHQMEVNNESFNLKKRLNETIEMMKDRAKKKHLTLSLHVLPSVPEEVSTDPHRLDQILLNLIGNAIKFTNEGDVTVKVERHGDHLEISVSDTGIGISKDKLKEIFESFRQVDSSSTRRHGGVGLGLAISKGLTELMGGSISAHSELGRGSVFSFTLPIKT